VRVGKALFEKKGDARSRLPRKDREKAMGGVVEEEAVVERKKAGEAVKGVREALERIGRNGV
jgi:hypothetical protein